MAWTLEYDGTEKSLAAWGIVDDLPFELNSQAKSLVDIITVDDFDDAFQWAYDSKVVIWRDRAGSGTSWAGGSRWFQGFVAEPRRLATGGRQNHRYTIYDWWWKAERTPLRRVRKSYTGDTLNFATLPPSEVVLFENELAQPVDTQLQFLELINLLNECWNPTRRGATGGQDPALDLVVDGDIETNLQVPRYPVRDIMVSEAIQQVLAWTQDAIIETDYDSNVVIVSVRRLPNMSTEIVNLPADRARGLMLKPRYDLQLPGVILYWKKVHTQDGVPGLQFVAEKYPTNLSVWFPNPRMHTIDLVGSFTNTVSAEIKTSAVLANDANDLLQHEWWTKHQHWIDNAKIPQLSFFIFDVTVEDKAGNPVSLAEYPYELLEGSITPWMEINAKVVVVKAWCAYIVYADAELITETEIVSYREIATEIVVCDYDTGGELEVKRTIAQNDPGEVVAFGLAQALYETHQTLQHEGAVELVGNEVPANLRLGQLLTVNTPGATYQENLIQRVTGELTRGRLTVYIGPPGHIGIADMISLMRVNRHRSGFSLKSNSNNPLLTGDGVELSTFTPKQDSTAGPPKRTKLAAVFDFSE